MAENQPLGGTRQSSPLADEMSYPLTNDEFLTIQDNLAVNQMTSWESILISTFFSTLVSLVVIYFQGSITKTIKVENVEKEVINTSQVVILVIYAAITLGTIVGFLFSRNLKNKAKKSIDRLIQKITNHLNV